MSMINFVLSWVRNEKDSFITSKPVLAWYSAMICPPVREDNQRALASGLSSVQVDRPWYNYFIPPTPV